MGTTGCKSMGDSGGDHKSDKSDQGVIGCHWVSLMFVVAGDLFLSCWGGFGESIDSCSSERCDVAKVEWGNRKPKGDTNGG